MTQKIINIVGGIITMLIVGVLILITFKLSSIEKTLSAPIVETVRVDTIQVTKTFQLPAPKAKTIYKDKIVTKDKIVFVGVADTMAMQRLQSENDLLQQRVAFVDSISTYSGTYRDGDLVLNYTHKTLGELLASEYDYTINEKTVTVEKVRTKKEKFAVGVESGFRTSLKSNVYDPYVGARVDVKRFSVNYNYSIQSKQHGVGVGYKIFTK